MNKTENADRKNLIHLVRAGKSPEEAAHELGKSKAWGYKWWGCFRTGGWKSIHERSRAPKRQAKEIPEETRQAIRQARSELEVEANEATSLSYIGAHAVQARLRKKGVSELPSISSIERVLKAAAMVRPRHKHAKDEIQYPHIHPYRPQQLIQVDIVPHFLPGGPCVSCFNAVDVVSHCPAGHQATSKNSATAAQFIWQVWQELGIPDYTQMDNEGCFSGGSTHPGVIGKVVRQGLLVGTETVFSPFYHPESNGYVERFHQDYNLNTWDKTELLDLSAVLQSSAWFFDAYRHSQHLAALNGQSPSSIHFARPGRKLPANFRVPAKLPITTGKVHFMRAVNKDHQVMILNMDWEVPLAKPDQGVWATLQISMQGAKLRIYDTAPDASRRICLVEYPFPLKEPVVPLGKQFQRPTSLRPRSPWLQTAAALFQRTILWLSTM
jgi:transposase